MKETMTIHKALSELKILGDRIVDGIQETSFVATNKHSNAKIAGKPVADYVNNVRDTYKSIRTLINRRNAIKRAVINSNALTKVEIGSKEYTVAEAIDMKSNGLGLLSTLQSKLAEQYKTASRAAERENGDKLDVRADTYVKSLYENADMKNMSEEVRKVRETFVESQMTDLIDPIDAQKTAQELKNQIDTFYSEVDSALSVSNALTTIEVEYETL